MKIAFTYKYLRPLRVPFVCFFFFCYFSFHKLVLVFLYHTHTKQLWSPILLCISKSFHFCVCHTTIFSFSFFLPENKINFEFQFFLWIFFFIELFRVIKLKKINFGWWFLRNGIRIGELEVFVCLCFWKMFFEFKILANWWIQAYDVWRNGWIAVMNEKEIKSDDKDELRKKHEISNAWSPSNGTVHSNANSSGNEF